MATGILHTGGYPMAGGDMPAANYGATDIPDGRIVLVDTVNVLSPSAAMGVVLPTAGGGVAKTWGITTTTLYAKGSLSKPKTGLVRVAGAYTVIADGAIAAGEYVQASDTLNKEGYAKVCAAATEQVGQAMNTVADGEPCLIWICKARNA
jgi:hypothetical protein